MSAFNLIPYVFEMNTLFCAFQKRKVYAANYVVFFSWQNVLSLLILRLTDSQVYADTLSLESLRYVTRCLFYIQPT